MLVYYDKKPPQKLQLRKLFSEQRKPIYATSFKSGAIIVDNGNIQLIGDVKTFDVSK